MKIKLRCFLMTLVVLNLFGCGMKGPLYMPEKITRVEQLPDAAPEEIVEEPVVDTEQP